MLKGSLVAGLLVSFAIATSTVSAQTARVSAGLARVFDATGPTAGASVLPWLIAYGSAVSLRVGVDGWLSYTKVASNSDMHRTMWGIGPVLEAQIPRIASPTALYTRVTAQVARSSIPDMLQTGDALQLLPDRVGVARSGLAFGGEIGMVMGHPGGRRFRFGVGYLRHSVYEGFTDGTPRVVLSVDL